MLIGLLADPTRAETLLNNLSEADFDLADVSLILKDIKQRDALARDAGPIKGVQAGKIGAEPRPGFHEKDKVENYLHDQACSGGLSLQQAQIEVATNWLAVYQQMPDK